MNEKNATAGVLAIMMGAGAIADFELCESNGEIFVRVWPAEDREILHLRKHIVALLPSHVEDRHVTVVEELQVRP